MERPYFDVSHEWSVIDQLFAKDLTSLMPARPESPALTVLSEPGLRGMPLLGP